MGLTLSRVTIIERVGEWVDLGLGALLGAECAVCGRALITGAVCDDCNSLTELEPPFCQRCGYPMAESMEECGECLNNAGNPLDEVSSLFWFDERARALWGRFKFHHCRELLRPLRERIAVKLSGEEVVPVPLSFSRFTKRWINHADWLAGLIAPCGRCDILTKVIDTSPQSLLKGALRASNVRGAFAILPGVEVPKRPILVDDIYTTGATLKECVRILKKAGAEQVRAWTLFRTPHEKRG